MNNLPVSEYQTDGTFFAYAYNANGMRIQETVGAGSPVLCAGGADGKTESVTSTSGTVATYNVWGGGGIVGQVKRNGASLTRSYLLKDHLGSIRTTVGSNMIVDNFSSDLSQWTTTQGGGFSIQNGELANSNAGDNYLINSSSQTFTDGIVAADVKNQVSQYAGGSLIVRYQDANNFYLVAVGDQGYVALFEKLAGTWYMRSQQVFLNPWPLPGVWHHLEGRLQEATISIYWDGVYKTSWTDATPWLSGKVPARQS